MEKERLWREFVALSEKDQQRVADFIFSLREDNMVSDPENERLSNFTEEPFVGMWRGREDMVDSSPWLRELREREWMGSDG